MSKTCKCNECGYEHDPEEEMPDGRLWMDEGEQEFTILDRAGRALHQEALSRGEDVMENYEENPYVGKAWRKRAQVVIDAIK
ncbi:MAG TPA: hypothetical protein VJ327_03905 [Patescibacteria group bacterium]|nr:hypothetical protein [Patescibacteria group bacterium]